MAFTAKALADGQVASSKSTIYTAPALTTTYVKSITLLNTNATEQTVNVYVNRSGTSRRIGRFALAQWEKGLIADNIVLEASDVLEADTTTASAVDYTVSGVEEA